MILTINGEHIEFASRKFKKEWLRELLWDDIDDAELVSDIIDDHRRWSVGHTIIFMFDGKFYKTSYSVGATEYQDEQPFEYCDDEIDCVEVEPVKVTAIEYNYVRA